ncbi:MAG: tetratricopeptide repeat protein [Terracidiphilus sp.]
MDRIVPLKGEGMVVKPVIAVALVAVCCLAAGPRLHAQAPADSKSNSNSKPNSNPASQSKPAAPAQTPASAPAQSNANAFPEDESSVPVLPSNNSPEVAPGTFDGAVNGRVALPAGDIDPVQSPDDSPAAGGVDTGSSSSLSGMDSLTPVPDDEEPAKHGRKRGDDVVPEHHETAAEDENVGKYYLDSKDWRAALSRYESALVLDPDNPDVYWGLAESERHLGNYADARGNYLKVMEYDPDSKHAKEAKKALEEPELANAKSSSAPQPAAQTPQ